MASSALRLIIGVAAGFGLLASQAALAGPGYSIVGFIAKGPVNQQLIAAYDKLNAAPIMKDRKSRGLLMANMADGADPATHGFVVVFPSEAYSESFSQKLMADPAWAEYQNTLSQLGSLAGSLRFQTIRSWGDISDADVVWETHAFRVKDWQAFIAATERYQATEAGKADPGQVHVVSVAAGGMTPATGAIVVGYASMAEREAWRDKYWLHAETQAYLADLDRSAEFLGTSIARTLAAYGATMSSTLGR